MEGIAGDMPSYQARCAKFPPLSACKSGASSTTDKIALMERTAAVERHFEQQGVGGAYIAAEVETLQLASYWARNFLWTYMQACSSRLLAANRFALALCSAWSETRRRLMSMSELYAVYVPATNTLASPS